MGKMVLIKRLSSPVGVLFDHYLKSLSKIKYLRSKCQNEMMKDCHSEDIVIRDTQHLELKRRLAELDKRIKTISRRIVTAQVATVAMQRW